MDVRGKSFDDFIPEYNRVHFNKLLYQTSLNTTLPASQFEKVELDALKSDGTTFPAEISFSSINIDSEIFFIVSVDNISHKKKMEVEKNLLTHAMKSINEVLLLIDLEGNIIFSNKISQDLFGYSASDIKTKNLRELCSPSDDSLLTDEIIPQSRQKPWYGEITCFNKEGIDFPFMLSTTPVADEHGNTILLICVGRDVSEREYLKEQLRHAQKMEALGLLTGGVAHDFNNLLIVISGYSNTILEELDKKNPHYKSIFQISKAAERATSLTRQLLAFSRKQILQPKLIDLNNLIRDMEKMLNRLIGENIKLKSFLEPDLERIVADPGHIEMVIMNLVINARDAMPGGGELTISTESIMLNNSEKKKYQSAKKGKYVKLKITDTGIGMSDKVKARIFEPFFTTKEKGKGTGLGLSTVYGIIEQSRFHIMVESKKNKGTSFNILIPKTSSIEQKEKEERKSFTKDIHGHETVLVVEDEEQVRELVVEMLQTYGYKVLFAGNGKDAIEIYNRSRNDICLILTDVVMPEMGGKKLIENLVNFKPGTKVLYMSGYTDNAIDEQGILDPGTEFIQKPFSPFDLLKKIRDVLDG